MKLVLIAVATLFFASFSFAEGGRACKEDVQKFCKDIKHGGGLVVKCLKQHESELSDACKGHKQKMTEHMKVTREACKEDIEKFCKDIPKKHGFMKECFKTHINEFSQSCKEAHNSIKK